MNLTRPFSALNPLPSMRANRIFEKNWYRAGRLTLDAVKHLAFSMSTVYHSPLPEGAKLLAANHPTTIDPAIMTTLVPEQVSILINEVLFKLPIFGRSLKASGHIRVVFSNGRDALDKGVQYLENGRTVGIFPEGVLSPKEGGQAHAHTGMARMALRTGVPVIPVGIALQKENIFNVKTVVDGVVEESKWYLYGGYGVTVGEPVTFTGDPEDREQVRQVTDQVMERIALLAQESARRVAERRVAFQITNPLCLLRWLRPVFSF